MIVDITGGAVLGCDDLGDPQNPGVILIGGLATQRTVWPDTLCDDLVHAGFRVIRFDNRDMGESTWSAAPTGPDLVRMIQEGLGPKDELAYTLHDLADDVVALMDALGVPTAHIVGMSMGGRIAKSVALRYPDRTASLVSMMSTTGNPDLPPPTPEAMPSLMTPPSDPYDVDAVTELAQAQQRVIGSPGYAMPDDYVRDVMALNFRRGNNPEGVMRQWLASVSAGDWRDRLSSLNTPTLILHGRDDPLVRYAAGEDCARTIPGAALRLIDGWGHNIPPAIGPLLAQELATFFNATD